MGRLALEIATPFEESCKRYYSCMATATLDTPTITLMIRMASHMTVSRVSTSSHGTLRSDSSFSPGSLRLVLRVAILITFRMVTPRAFVVGHRITVLVGHVDPGSPTLTPVMGELKSVPTVALHFVTE